jgi:hypothetical protein
MHFHLYADDVALFLKPTSHDLSATIEILDIFVGATSLETNMSKTEYYPIHCAGNNLNFLDMIDLKISHFPCTYLGLPLHYRKPTRVMFQPVILKIGGRLHGWKRNFMSYARRELLVKSVLTAMPTYFMTVFKMPKWTHSKIDKYRRSFLWRGEDPKKVNGGHCLVNWQTCLRHKRWGGLGIKDLDKFSRALRMRWLWHSWDKKKKP